MHALKKWKHYLLGSQVLVYADNVALKFLRTAQNLSPRKVRLVQVVGIKNLHIPGKYNTAADALSRLMRLNPMQSVDSEKNYWKRTYLADPVMGSKYFTASGEPVDLTCWHFGRLWRADRILVPS